MSDSPGETTEGGPPWLPVEVSLALSVEGALNPAIFHPQWFAREKLLHQSEAENATVELNADDYSLFRTRDLTMEVSRDSLTLMTRSEAFEPTLKEIFEGIFLLLRHTPLKEFSISRFTHWRRNPADPDVDAEYSWQALLLQEPWEDIVTDPIPGGIAMDGRTREGVGVTVAIEPSELSKEAQVYIGCRYTWSLPEQSAIEHLLSALKDDWDSTHRHAEEATLKLLSLDTESRQGKVKGG